MLTGLLFLPYITNSYTTQAQLKTKSGSWIKLASAPEIRYSRKAQETPRTNLNYRIQRSFHIRTISARMVASILFGALVSSALFSADYRNVKIDVANRSQSTDPGVWGAIGPAPPAIEAAIGVHAPSHTIYIGSLGGGVLKSTDGGASFAAINNGLDSLVVASLAMAPNDPNLVYASTGTGIYKTVDGGATWNVTGEGGLPLTLVMDPTNPNILKSTASISSGLAQCDASLFRRP